MAMLIRFSPLAIHIAKYLVSSSTFVVCDSMHTIGLHLQCIIDMTNQSESYSPAYHAYYILL